MAQRVLVSLIDDISGKPADETIRFTYEHTAYVIDLSKKNAEQFRSALAPYLTAGRRIAGGNSRKPDRMPPARARTLARKAQRAGIREWARARGLSVSERGRISGDVIAQYDAAH